MSWATYVQFCSWQIGLTGLSIVVLMPDLPFMTSKTLLLKRLQYSYLAFFAHGYSPRVHFAARAPLRRFAPRVLRWKTLRVSSAPHPCGFESHAPGPKKKGLHRWRPNNSVVGDEGCPRAAGAVRAPLRRFAPRVLRWKTLRVSSAPHPCGFESHAPGPKKKGLHRWRPNNSMVGDEGFEPPALCV